jgi:hypothetical protein
MTRPILLFLTIVLIVAAAVAVIRVRTQRIPGPPPDEDVPTAPDLDSIPGDTTYFGQIIHDRARIDAFLRGDESPLEDSERTRFQGLKYFPPNLAYRLHLRLETAADRDTVVLMDTKGAERVYERLGVLRFRLNDRPQSLSLFREPQHNYLFLPFKDVTSGEETYEVGRYVEPQDVGGEVFLVDFNRAYNPYCAYSHRWACPIPPAENSLDVAVRAGEMKYRAN